MFYSLRLRVLVTLTLVVAVTVGGIALFSMLATSRMFYRYEADRGMTRHRRLENVLAWYYGENGSWSGVQAMVERLGHLSGEWVVLASEEGQIIADSGGELMGQPVGRDWDTPAAEIVDGGVTVGVVYAGFRGSGAGTANRALPGPARLPPFGPRPRGLDTVSEVFLRSLNRSLLLVAVIAGLAAVVLSLLLSRRVLGPVEALTAAARRMESGDLSQRVEVRSRDEIGELAHAFNAMAEGLARLEDLRRNMVTDVAHELRTPLSNVRGYLEAFRDGVMEPNPETIESIYEEAMLLNRLVDDLQEISLADARQLGLDRRPVEPGEMLRQAVNAAQGQAKARKIMLRLDLPSELPLVEADSRRIEQVVGNLLDNALAHTAPGGEIVTAARSKAGEVEISVTDRGEGIAPEHLPHVFDRFYRVDKSRSRATGGTGLGLAIARQLVEGHGGRISVDSQVGQGTKFRFTLPVARPGA
jgi:signal transduction histidine kinase